MKKYLALILALVLVIGSVAVLASCGKNEETETTTEAQIVNDDDADAAEDLLAAAMEEDEDAEETEAAEDAEDTDTADDAEETEEADAADDTTEAEDSKEDKKDDKKEDKTEAKKSITEGTKAEKVAYFNEVANKAKKDSKSITSVSMTHALNGSITGLPSSINNVMKLLGGVDDFVAGFMGEDDSMSNVTWTGDDKNEHFPVEGETWASKLTADDVKAIVISENSDGKTYTVIAVVKDDDATSNVKHGQGHNAKAFNVVMPAVVADNIPGVVASAFSVGDVSMSYGESKVTYVVDKETGKVTDAKYELYWTIHIPLGDNVVVLPFKTTNVYKIAW